MNWGCVATSNPGASSNKERTSIWGTRRVKAHSPRGRTFTGHAPRIAHAGKSGLRAMGLKIASGRSVSVPCRIPPLACGAAGAASRCPRRASQEAWLVWRTSRL